MRAIASLSHWPSGLAWSPDGREIWFADWGGPEGTVFSAATLEGQQRVVSRLPGHFALHDLSSAGDVLVSQSLLTVASAIYVPGADRERDLTWLDMGLVKDISNDGQVVLMDEQGAGVAAEPQAFLRRADGSPPIHLGAGLARGLSPDGRWALVADHGELKLLPTGTGEAKAIQLPGITIAMQSSWFPDGQHILVSGNEEGARSRLYVVPVAGGHPRAITPEGVAFPAGLAAKPVSPDGKKVFALAGTRELRIHEVATGESIFAHVLEEDEEPLRWDKDGRSIFLWKRGEVPARITRLDLETQEKKLWKELVLSDPTGVIATRFVVVTPDGQTFACSYVRMLSQLHVVRGLR
jgi:sugar lactone lactonase YvrE